MISELLALLVVCATSSILWLVGAALFVLFLPITVLIWLLDVVGL